MEHIYIYFSLFGLIIFILFLLLSIIYPHIILVWLMDYYIKSGKGDKISSLLRRWKLFISIGSIFNPFACYVIRKSKYKVESLNYLIDLNYSINIPCSIYYAINLKDKELIKLLFEKGNANLLEFSSLELLLTMDDELINYTIDCFLSLKQNINNKELLITQILYENTSYNIFNNDDMFHMFFSELTNILLRDIKPPYDLFARLNESITLIKEIKHVVQQCTKLNQFYLLMIILNYHYPKGQLLKNITVVKSKIRITFSDDRIIDYSYTLNQLNEYITSFEDGRSWEDYQSSLFRKYNNHSEFILQQLLPSVKKENLSILLTLAIVNNWNDYLINKLIEFDASFDDKLEKLVFDYLQKNVMKESLSHINHITALCVNYFNNEGNIKEVLSLVLDSKIERTKNKILTDQKYLNAYERVNENELYINNIDDMSDIEFENYLNILFKLLGYKNIKIVSNTNDQKINIIMEKDGEIVGVLAKLCSENVNNKVVNEAKKGVSYYQLDKVIIVTNTTFTKSAIDLAIDENVSLLDKFKLRDLLKNVDRERFIRHLRFNFPVNKSKIDNDHSIEMSYTYRLLQQAKNGIELSNIIHKGIHDFNIMDEYGKTPLMYAIESKNAKIVKQILGYNFDINITDLQGKTALHYLFDFKNYYTKEIWNIFISKDADLYSLDTKNRCIMLLLKEELTEEQFLKHPVFKIHMNSIYKLDRFKLIYNNM